MLCFDGLCTFLLYGVVVVRKYVRLVVFVRRSCAQFFFLSTEFKKDRLCFFACISRDVARRMSNDDVLLCCRGFIASLVP